MAEFVIRLADERGRLQEQVQTAASAEELRTPLHAGRVLRLFGEGAGVPRPQQARSSSKSF